MKHDGNTERFIRHAGRHKAWYASLTSSGAVLAAVGFILAHYTIPWWDEWRANILTAEQQAAQIPALVERLDKQRDAIKALREENGTLRNEMDQLKIQLARHR